MRRGRGRGEAGTVAGGTVRLGCWGVGPGCLRRWVREEARLAGDLGHGEGEQGAKGAGDSGVGEREGGRASPGTGAKRPGGAGMLRRRRGRWRWLGASAGSESGALGGGSRARADR